MMSFYIPFLLLVVLRQPAAHHRRMDEHHTYLYVIRNSGQRTNQMEYQIFKTRKDHYPYPDSTQRWYQANNSFDRRLTDPQVRPTRDNVSNKNKNQTPLSDVSIHQKKINRF